MRYEKGSIEISRTQDVPPMQQVLRSGFATGARLFEFMKRENCEYSQKAFYHRLRWLVGWGLVKKGDGWPSRCIGSTNWARLFWSVKGSCMPDVAERRWRSAISSTGWS